MDIRIVSPTKALLTAYTVEELISLKDQLSYINTAAQYLVSRHYNNTMFRSRNPEGWGQHLDTLKKDVNCQCVYQENGVLYIRPGSIPYIKDIYMIVENYVKYPTPKKIAWHKPLPFELHDYQELSWQKLLEEKHGNVELTTASGKSAILLKLCRETGFRAAIVAPGKVVFNELLEKFETHFGKSKVGTFGDGKKKIGKQFTICISDSLSNVKPGSPEWDFFQGLDMIAVDESHTWGAETLDELCHGIFSTVPYRFFLSATQTRGDGSEKLLQSIIGRTVHTLPTWEAKERGFIADHDYSIVQVESSNPNFRTKDPLAMKRAHFLNNKNIAAFIAKLANANATIHGKQTLIMVEELHQIQMLMKLLTVPVAYAHSESKKDRLLELGLEKVDPAESVEAFNRNDVKVLIGTSCIATGTNIFPVHNCVNWVGGISEIRTKQGAVGRSVRLTQYNPYSSRCVPKEKATIWDFDVYDVDLMRKHLKERIEHYKESHSEIRHIKAIR